MTTTWTAFIAGPGERNASEELDVQATTKKDAQEKANAALKADYQKGCRVTRIVRTRADLYVWSL